MFVLARLLGWRPSNTVSPITHNLAPISFGSPGMAGAAQGSSRLPKAAGRLVWRHDLQATESVSGALGGATGGTEWEFYATGHSLGGFLAAAVTIELDPDISKCARPCVAVLALACCVLAGVTPAGSLEG